MHREPEDIIEIRDPSCGLCAFLVIDDTTFGPAAGGVRTKSYPSEAAALGDARALAHAMTLKCVVADLKAGGGKCVVMDHEMLDRPRAFAVLGREIEALGGRFRTAGDLGTTSADLEVMARYTRYIHREEGLADAVGRGLLSCAKEAANFAKWNGLTGRHAVVQGTGAIGTAVARALADAGMRITLSDLDPSRAADRAAEIGAQVVPPEKVLLTPCDLLSPCAIGGVVTSDVAQQIQTQMLCGAANNILADERAAEVLWARGILHVPDVIASAGAVIEGIGRSVMGLTDTSRLINQLGGTVLFFLHEAQLADRNPEVVLKEQIERWITLGRVQSSPSPPGKA